MDPQGHQAALSQNQVKVGVLGKYPLRLLASGVLEMPRLTTSLYFRDR
jgi:hypothetical protein